MGALGAKASELSMKDETTGVFIQHSLMRSGLRDAGGEAWRESESQALGASSSVIAYPNTRLAAL